MRDRAVLLTETIGARIADGMGTSRRRDRRTGDYFPSCGLTLGSAGVPVKPVSIRAGVLADADVLRDLHRRSSLVYEDTRSLLLAHPEVFGVSAEAIRAGYVRVLVRTGRIVAFATVIPRPDGVEELDDLFVDPKCMRQGLGRALIDDAVVIARNRRLRRLEVTANKNALAFYANVGFVLDGEASTEFGPGLRMYLDLTDRQSP